MSQTVRFKFAMDQAVQGKNIAGSTTTGTVIAQHAFINGSRMYAVMTEVGEVFECREHDIVART